MAKSYDQTDRGNFRAFKNNACPYVERLRNDQRFWEGLPKLGGRLD